MIDRRLNYGRDVIEQMLRSSAPYRNVLDIGAGRGADLELARIVTPTAELHAVESFSANVEHLTRLGATVHDIDVEREALPLADESFDLVITNQTMEHVKEVFWILHEMTRVLRVGGRLLIGVPNLASLHNRVALLLGRQPTSIKNNSAHVRGYTRSDLVRLVETGFPGGYRVVGFRGSNFYPFPPVLAKPLARALPSMAWAIFVLLEKQTSYAGEYLRYPLEHRLETNFFLGPADDGATHTAFGRRARRDS